MNKCEGCGSILQYDDINKKGYTSKKESNICDRCFKIKNYNFKDINKNEINNENILEKINKYHVFTIFMCDIYTLNKDIINIYKKIKNNKILVISKIDILPKNIDILSLEKRINDLYDVKCLCLSIKNKYGLNEIRNVIDKYDNILFCGPTSSGKSSLINFIFNSNLTVSSYNNTTLDFVKVNIDNKKIIIDAPGFDDDFYLDKKEDKGVIKPKTIILKKEYELFINDLRIYSDKDINITLYFNNMVKINTKKKIDNFENSIKINSKNDLLYHNIGFIYFKDNTTIYTNSDDLKVRESIVVK